MSKYKPMWKLEQKTDIPNTLQLYIYGDVVSDSYDYWKDEIIKSETSANYFRNELEKYPNVNEIEIYINSWGGSVFEGTAIYNQLRRHSAHKTVYIDGFACSIASVIACAGDKVIMPRNAMQMIHNAAMCAYGNSEQLRKAADDLDQINKGNRQAYLQKAGGKITEEKLIELLDNESYLTAEDCINYGLADEYAEDDADMTKINQMLSQQNLRIDQQLKIRNSLLNQMKELSISQTVDDGLKKETPKEPEQKKNLFFLLKNL